ncbi:MAG: phosphotransferase family protein [Eubacterium sp.]
MSMEQETDNEVLESVSGLSGYVRSEKYRKALGLPERKVEIYHTLAQGEYNRNFWFVHPVTGRKLVLRVNFGSQMHLPDQIGYEYRALKDLHGCGRTPEVLYVDGSLRDLDHGIMVMEFLPGGALQYRRKGDPDKAAYILADIHAQPLKHPEQLVRSRQPLKEMLDECEQMQQLYQDSDLGDREVKALIRECLDRGHRAAEKYETDIPYRCCINTELNNTNFLIQPDSSDLPPYEGNYLIDWEKPLYGDPAQDLGHFLAPTTTFWKTDVIFTEEEQKAFIDAYLKAAGKRFCTDGLRERTNVFTRMTCLRGITWCAMAWVQYRQTDHQGLKNASTAAKLDAYVDPDFIRKYGLLPQSV